jgi:hypothetical protein
VAKTKPLSKAELARRAVQVRLDDLGIDQYQAFSPYDLAAEHGVDVYGLDDLDQAGCAKSTIEFFSSTASGIWSAALVPRGTGCFIVENTSHNPQRRRSNVAHEMAHLILEHEFDWILFSADAKGGCRNPATKELESEAAELGAELLIPVEAARRAAIYDLTNEQVAAAYDISVEMATWRMNATGARKFAARAKAKRFAQARR